MENFFVRASLLAFLGVSVSIFVSGCVTINIYFPAAAAEKAADKIIEDVWQLKKPGESGQGTDSAAPSGSAVQPAGQPQPSVQPQQ